MAILANRAQCKKCRDTIESKHRHDFVACSCGAIFVDGGVDYLRRGERESGDLIEMAELGHRPAIERRA